jgi:hypothetical protein
MAHSDEAARNPEQPPLADLMARYLRQRTEDQNAGLVSKDAAGDVVPFEAAPVQTVDPRLAWDEALAAIPLLHPESGSQASRK